MSWSIDRALDVTASPMALMERFCPTETRFHSDYEPCLAHETIADHHWGRLGLRVSTAGCGNKMR